MRHREGAKPGLCNMWANIKHFQAALVKLDENIRIDASGCHMWTGGRDYSGYGKVYLEGKTYSVHRLMYELVHGPIPSEGAPDKMGWRVLHKCDIPACCNAEHLYVGDAADNARDMADRARIRRGDRIDIYRRGKKDPQERFGTVFYEIEGVIKSIREWSEQYGIHQTTFESRLISGWQPQHLGVSPRSGFRHYGDRASYRRFSGVPQVEQYLLEKNAPAVTAAEAPI